MMRVLSEKASVDPTPPSSLFPSRFSSRRTSMAKVPGGGPGLDSVVEEKLDDKPVEDEVMKEAHSTSLPSTTSLPMSMSLPLSSADVIFPKASGQASLPSKTQTTVEGPASPDPGFSTTGTAKPSQPDEVRAPRMDRAQSAVRRALSEGATTEVPDAKRRAFVPLMLGGKSIDVMLAEQDTCIHPLVRAVRAAQQDLEKGLFFNEDFGTWDGRWSLPSRGDYETMQESGSSWPTGGALPGHDVLQAGSHKEVQWSKLSEEDRDKFRTAAKDQWNKWLENEAVKVLSFEESKNVYKELERKNELSRVLKPRFVLTDKNAAHRTQDSPLPLLAAARIVVPGYRDIENLRGELRRDAPTGSRQSQHVLFIIAAANPPWYLCSADVRAAFLKGDPYIKRTNSLHDQFRPHQRSQHTDSQWMSGTGSERCIWTSRCAKRMVSSA